MIRTWFYLLAPLWVVERVVSVMNPILVRMDHEVWGIPVWKRKDGTEIWVCRRTPKDLRGIVE
jgi:hypothetical protein